jgi:hypothetical protein
LNFFFYFKFKDKSSNFIKLLKLLAIYLNP